MLTYVTQLKIVGEMFCGDVLDHQFELPPHSAMRIMTGAPIPRGADTVVIKEKVQVLTKGQDAFVCLSQPVKKNANIRYEGEDVALNAIVGDDGNTYNINADIVAGEVAATLEAEKLILLTDTRGILLDPSDETTLIPTLNTNQIDSYIQNGVIGAGMLPKVEACTTALAASVSKTHIIDGRLKHAMLLEIFTSHGIGTEIVKT